MTTPKTPVRIAVEPFLLEAQERAERYARSTIADYLVKLEADGWDLQKTCPYPSLRNAGHEYHSQLAKHKIYLEITDYTQSSRSPYTPDIRKPNKELEERYVQKARENAALQYESFIIKLENKIGEHSAAEISGSHVWGHSILTVTTPKGIERWKTQMIINVSKNGLLFNQFPTRKVK